MFDPNLQQYGSILTPEQQQAVLLATQAAGGDIALAAQQLMTQPGLFPPAQDPYQQVLSPISWQGGCVCVCVCARVCVHMCVCVCVCVCAYMHV